MKRQLLTMVLLMCLGSTAFGQVVAAFYGAPLTVCSQPYDVSFFNLSINDTSSMWDFGDGNTSTVENPTHTYMNPGVYTVTLIVLGVGGTDTLVRTNYVDVLPPIPAPTLNQLSDTVSCGGSTQFIGTSQNLLRWYDANQRLIHQGDILDIPLVTSSATFYVRDELDSPPAHVGPLDPDSVGDGGYFNGEQGLEFDVLAQMRLVSVLVDAATGGSRDIVLEDDMGNVLQTITVFIPQGKGRVYLNLELSPGSYVIGGDNLDLFRNNDGGTNYPYVIPEVVSITGSTVNDDFYYFFYDWEVVAFCHSSTVQVDLLSTPIDPPVINQDTVATNCGAGVEVIASSTNEVHWYDAAGGEVAVGDTLDLSFVGTNTSYSARSETQTTPVFFGPANGAAIGTGSNYSSPDLSWLLFDVDANMTLHSVLVSAGAAGARTILLIDDEGNTVQTTTVTLPSGASRIDFDVALSPGSYLLGGNNLDLYRNDTVASGGLPSYPYSIAGTALITGTSDGPTFYNFFYDWEISTECVSGSDSFHVTVSPLPNPTVSQDSLAVMCEGNAQFIASSANNVTWYDESNNVVGTGDTLDLTNLSSSASYFARSVEAGPSQFMDPLDPAPLGGGGYHGNAGAFLEFEVHSGIRLVSVWVDAETAGDRIIELQDSLENTIRTMIINIPQGPSRITLDLDLDPGVYRLGGANMDLFRNNDGPYYPYSLPGQVTIFGSSAFNSEAFYYYFYNWEVVSLCQSEAIPVIVDILPLPAPSVTADDTVCYGGSALFETTASNASWYGPDGSFLGSGASLMSPPLTAGGTYSAVAENIVSQQNVGPLDNTVGNGGGYFNGNQGLEFTVLSPVRINSAWVDAGSDGNRDIILEDGDGNLIQVLSRFISAGQSRIGLGLELQPGDYVISGDEMDLWRNNNGGLDYPYEIPGLVSITGSTAGFGFYYFFYDWEVQELPCTSPPTDFNVTVMPQLLADFSFTQMQGDFIFADNSTGATGWSWDFGDGNTSDMQHPQHSYASNGSFVVTLTVTNWNCESTFTDTVAVEGVGIEDLLVGGQMEVYPNPGGGIFTVKATAHKASYMELHIFDLTGREVYATTPKKQIQFQEEVNLSPLAAGSYFVQLKVDGFPVMKKYVMVK